MSTQVRSIAELERIRENTPESELRFLHQQDRTAWEWCRRRRARAANSRKVEAQSGGEESSRAEASGTPAGRAASDAQSIEQNHGGGWTLRPRADRTKSAGDVREARRCGPRCGAGRAHPGIGIEASGLRKKGWPPMTFATMRPENICQIWKSKRTISNAPWRASSRAEKGSRGENTASRATMRGVRCGRLPARCANLPCQPRRILVDLLASLPTMEGQRELDSNSRMGSANWPARRRRRPDGITASAPPTE